MKAIVCTKYGSPEVLQFKEEAEPTNSLNESTVNKFINDYAFIDPFYGEISIGYAF